MDSATSGSAGALRATLAVRVEAYSWQSAIARNRLVALGDNPLVIGSDPSCDIAIYDPNIAPNHAAIVPVPNGGHALEDLGSPAGTWVQGARITQPLRLAPGEMIRIGEAMLTVVALTPVVVAQQGVQPVQVVGESARPISARHESGSAQQPVAPAIPVLPAHAVPAAPPNVQPLSQSEIIPEERGQLATVPYCPLCAIAYPRGAVVCAVCGSRLTEAMAD